MGQDDAEVTLRLDINELDRTRKLRALVFANDTFSIHSLPTSGEVVFGRGAEADVRIDEASVSRLHAKLHLPPAHDFRPMEIEDLGATNGVRVRDLRLAPQHRVPIELGEPIYLGACLLFVQTAPTRGRPRRISTHDYFELRLEEECERARRSSGHFSVIGVKVEAGRPHSNKVEEILTGSVRGYDVVATYAPNEFEVLLVDTTLEQARSIVAALSEALTALGVPLKSALASFPEDGVNPETLVANVHRRLLGVETGDDHPSVIIADPEMIRLHDLAARVAPSALSVLILGETGTGKELLAEAVHLRSTRAKMPFLRVNCAALNEALLESELFGHERGAFTGAVGAKEGLLESVDGGTFLLDEVGELPPGTQAKLLRVIEEGQLLRVGAVKPRPIDVRFIAATNRDLEQEVAQGRFRKDLYYRLSGVTLVIPPLRERVAEIEPLSRCFARRAAGPSSPEPVFTPEALALLRAYAWPGNVRELRNAIERAVLLSKGEPIGKRHLPLEKLGMALVTAPVSHRKPLAPAPQPGALGPVLHSSAPPRYDGDETTEIPTQGPWLQEGEEGQRPGLKGELEELEKRRILEALERCNGNQTQAAKLLGMARRTLISRLDAYQLERPRKGPTVPSSD